ncbi:unnamed protein product, partial [Didymodactylos carnosus]
TTTVTHFTSFQFDITDEKKLENIVNDTVRLVTRCEKISDYKMGNLIMFPISLALIVLFSWFIKSDKKWLKHCDGRPGLIPPIEPFRTANRFTTATVFGILAFEVLKIFEELLFSTTEPSEQGVLLELIQRIAIVLLVGMRYYPILASLQLRNCFCRCTTWLYILLDLSYTIYREGSCMGFLPLSKQFSAIEESKLRIELGTWFIIYGIIKNTPHFICLSYIASELTVRFLYDSCYKQVKSKKSIWASPVMEYDEYQFSRYYVMKLFRRNPKYYPNDQTNSVPGTTDITNDDEEWRWYEKQEKSRVKLFLDKIYPWDDDFRFTTIALCTYTVAIIFLYYLACTLVFLYLSRTFGHTAFLRSYLEQVLNVELSGWSFKLEVLSSAFLTSLLYLWQLFNGMLTYKKHKKELFQGIYLNVPTSAGMKPNSVAAKSVHYSGFLVGYMAWGYIICFHLIFFVLGILRLFRARVRYIELLMTIIVPVLVIYLMKLVMVSSAGKCLFIQDLGDKLNLKNRKTYAVFVYFNFFADCFLGIASCIIRLIKATCLNIAYMARLDCSFLGRPLEKYARSSLRHQNKCLSFYPDIGFAAYVSYLHMEVTHTHPVMLAFCYSLYDDVIKRRKKGYDDECCIGPGEFDSDNETDKTVNTITESQRNDRTRKNNVDHINNDDDLYTEIKKSLENGFKSNTKGQHQQSQKQITADSKSQDENVNERLPVKNNESTTFETIAQIMPHKQPALPIYKDDNDDDDDDDQADDGGPPTPKGIEKPKSTQKHVKDVGDEVEFDDDGGIVPKSYPTIEKALVKNAKRPRLPEITTSNQTNAPKIPQRQDRPKLKVSEDFEEDEDGGIVPKTYDTIAKAIPKERPRLNPMQQSAKKQNKSEVDDNGSLKPEVKKVTELKSQDKEQTKDEQGRNTTTKVTSKQKGSQKKAEKQIVEDIEDDDGGIVRPPQTYDTIIKVISKKKPVLSKIENSSISDHDEKNRVHNSKGKSLDKKTKNNKVRPVQSEDDLLEDDDGGIRKSNKSYDTVFKLIPSTKPKLPDNSRRSDSKVKKRGVGGSDNSSINKPELKLARSLLRSSSNEEDERMKIYDKIKHSYDDGNKNNNNNTATTTTSNDDEEIKYDNRKQYRPPTYDQVQNHTQMLRTISYRQAQQSPPPPLPSRQPLIDKNNQNNHQPHVSSSNQSNSDSVLPSSRTISDGGSLQSSPSTSIQEIQSQKQQQSAKQDIDGDTEADVRTDDDEEDADEDSQSSSQRSVLEPLPNITTANPTLSKVFPLLPQEKVQEQAIVLKRKRARFRWYLAYTILNNYHLFDLRRLVALRLHRSNIQMEQQPIQSAEISKKTQSQQPYLSVPSRQFEETPHSPAEIYIRNKANQLIDASPPPPFFPVSPSVIDQNILFNNANGERQSKMATHSQVSIYSQGFPIVRIHPPSDETTTSTTRQIDSETIGGTNRPPFVRQKSVPPPSTSSIVYTDRTPFLPVTNSTVSDEQTGIRTMTTSPTTTLLTTLSHQQQMQSWKQKKMEKLRKKHPHCYVYGGQEPIANNPLASAILTPFLVHSIKKATPQGTAMVGRQTRSPFYGHNINNNINNNSNNNNNNAQQAQTRRVHTAPISNSRSSNQFEVVSEIKGDDNQHHSKKHKRHSKKNTEQSQPIPPPRMDLKTVESSKPYESFGFTVVGHDSPNRSNSASFQQSDVRQKRTINSALSNISVGQSQHPSSSNSAKNQIIYNSSLSTNHESTAV